MDTLCVKVFRTSNKKKLVESYILCIPHFPIEIRSQSLKPSSQNQITVHERTAQTIEKEIDQYKILGQDSVNLLLPHDEEEDLNGVQAYSI